MRITCIKALPFTIQRLKELKVAYATRKVYQGILLRLETDAGLTGLGEAAPNLEVCGETPESAAGALAAMAPLVHGRNPLERERILSALEPWRHAHASALAAYDIALWDLAGKAAGQPIRALAGGFRERIANAMTIGIMGLEETLQEARSIRASGRFQEIKLKLGLDPELDVARVRAVRAELGPDFPLHVDANQGYSRETALEVLSRLADQGIAFVEQPVSAADLDGLKWVHERSPVPVMADEAVRSPEDALRLVRAQACAMLNVKLQKVGGISRALDVLAIARSAGLPCLVGCMTETLVGTTAGAHVALASPAVAHVDLDGHVDLALSPVTGGIYLTGAQLSVPASPGLGVELDQAFQAQFQAARPLEA
jgi:L-alanine-DL-glutamate epimerase-like enolase superfamily enzyme